MLARIRKAKETEGFTLIELLVVIIIIGILAAIAIPVFLNQRQKGVDAGIKSDLKQVANELESSFTDAQTYNPAVDIQITTGNEFDGGLNALGTAYCVSAFNEKGSHNAAGNEYVYISDQGGLQPSAVVVCPGGYDTTPIVVS
jgi:prepilin-type N-terminal cleavage/methylation domain-containing protein